MKAEDLKKFGVYRNAGVKYVYIGKDLDGDFWFLSEKPKTSTELTWIKSFILDIENILNILNIRYSVNQNIIYDYCFLSKNPSYDESFMNNLVFDRMLNITENISKKIVLKLNFV